MRFKLTALTLILVLVAGSIAAETESEIVARYLKKTEEKHTQGLSFLSLDFTFNRVNRDNDYNKFATYESQNFSTTNLSWLGDAKVLGFQGGVFLHKGLAWTLGGQYWFKLGESQSGTFEYTPSGGSATTVQDLTSEVSVWGVTTGVTYYPFTKPTPTSQLDGLALRVGGTIGWYQCSWQVWDEYQSLNLSTGLSQTDNIEFAGSSIGFSGVIGADYPLKWKNVALGLEVGYLYLNFANVAWYNSSDQEIVATHTGGTEGRVDLGLSGPTIKAEVKKFFSW